MALTYDALATVTVGSGGAANIEFTNIPGTYTDLVIKVSARSETTTDWASMDFNNSGANFTLRALRGSGSSADSYSASDNDYSFFNTPSSYTANTFNSFEAYIPNYASSNNKSVSIDQTTENNATLSYINATAILWSNSAAITSIKFTMNSTSDFAQYSTATLYGIKNTV